LGGKTAKASVSFYEVLEPRTAQTLARFSNIPGHPPAVTVNWIGKGRAIYQATPAQTSLIGPLVRSLYGSLEIQPGPKTPEGVYARIVDGRTFYVNTTEEEKDVAVSMNGHGILSRKSYAGQMKLGPYQAELVEEK
jgi:beta-galactosidase